MLQVADTKFRIHLVSNAFIFTPVLNYPILNLGFIFQLHHVLDFSLPANKCPELFCLVMRRAVGENVGLEI